MLHKPIKPRALLDQLEGVFDDRAGTNGINTGASSEAAEPDPEAAETVDPSTLKLLLVEDDLVNQTVATHLLQRLDLKADVANNGQEGVEMASQKSYDIVFMDMHMPVRDGLSAARGIRDELPEDHQPYIVAMTAAVSKQDRENCEAAGMDDFVSKPILVDQLSAAIDRALQARFQRSLAAPAGSASV
jgi:CheY-like chemotaxis protein